MEPYDAIVIGGGHNGLVAGAYLAQGGARTVVLEARHKIGGADQHGLRVGADREGCGREAHRDRLARRPDEATVTALPFLDPKKEIPAKG